MDEEFIKILTNRVKEQEWITHPEELQMKKAALRLYKRHKFTNPLTDIIRNQLHNRFDSPRSDSYE